MTARNSVAGRKAAMYKESERVLTAKEQERLRARKTPPKKYLDKERTITSPEWTFWSQIQRDPLADPADPDTFWDFMSAMPFRHMAGSPVDELAMHSMYFPEEYDKDLGDGAWVFVIEPPVTVQSNDYKVPLLSIWWARPYVVNTSAVAGRLPYQGVIQTPAGDLHLWPHEYTVLKNPEGIIGEEGTTIHSLGGEPLLDEEKLFYLQSRGIERREATLLLFSQIEDGSGFAYITLHPDLVSLFAGVGTRTFGQVRFRHLDGEFA